MGGRDAANVGFTPSRVYTSLIVLMSTELVRAAKATDTTSVSRNGIRNGRLEHGQSGMRRIHANGIQSFAEMLVTALENKVPVILNGLSSQGYAVIDDFMPDEFIQLMRSDAAALHRNGRTLPSLTEVEYENGSAEVVQKPGVFAYEKLLQEPIEPQLLEFVELMNKHIPELFNARFPEMHIASLLYGHKLTVTTGAGSDNPLHFDRKGDDDIRKLTTILYLQDRWTTQQGGQLRLFEAQDPHIDLDKADLGAHIDVAPLGGRLVAFWSETIPHTVLPTYALTEDTHRWAFTVWFPRDNEKSRIERVENDWSALYEGLESAHKELSDAQLQELAHEAYEDKFGCTLEEQIARVQEAYEL